jgi:predicted nuclease of predicted toxin-antitoxin system
MKIKLDENLPVRLATLLKTFGHNVHTVHDEGRVGNADKEIWEAAQRESRFFVTQDLDFSDSRRFAPGSHHGVLLVQLRSPNRRSLISRIGEPFDQENASEWAGCFVVATERKIRIRRPGHKLNS